jgi:hypothetical protein
MSIFNGPCDRVQYQTSVVMIRFFGTHAEYDEIDWAASVRLYEFRGAQLADGRHVDASDAVWVSIASASSDRSIVEVGKLTFDQAAAGSMQARFGDALCVMNPDLQRQGASLSSCAVVLSAELVYEEGKFGYKDSRKS